MKTNFIVIKLPIIQWTINILSLSYNQFQCWLVQFVREKFNWKLKGGALFTSYLQT